MMDLNERKDFMHDFSEPYITTVRCESLRTDRANLDGERFWRSSRRGGNPEGLATHVTLLIKTAFLRIFP